ncbi:MAG TPA: inositol monophosphatase [Acidimicrobiales bacterium]|nr:inositol monophosphatase [Acidimicrobiales bacterium]
MSDEELAQLLRTAARAVQAAISGHRGRGLSGLRPTQYHADLVADAAAIEVLASGGLQVLSEESGRTGEGSRVCVLDPIDGSTNFDRGIPYYSTSMCVLDDQGMRCSLVANLATDTWYEATRGRGATRDGDPIQPSSATSIKGSILSFSGFPGRHGGWAQHRALGSAALELCAVADGSLDAFGVVGTAHLSPWDYLGGLLVVHEAGGIVTDLDDAELVEASTARHQLCAAGTASLSTELVAFARGLREMHGPSATT